MEKWDEALFGVEEAPKPVEVKKEASPLPKPPVPGNAVKEFLPEGSGGRALEENQKAQASLRADIEKMSVQSLPIEDIKKKQDALKKLQEDETRIRAGGI